MLLDEWNYGSFRCVFRLLIEGMNVTGDDGCIEDK